ncbi:MAG: glucose 1-dehydrogenase [Actinobacteria bacterium]|nr:glucose 1-dehydrogenase [Actinomycetota bacterium]
MLDGRVALVTGGGSGLGEAISRRLAEEGARVVVADVDGDAAARVAAGVDGRAIAGDVCSTDDVRRMVAAASDLGPLRALVLAAAIETKTPAVECSDDEWQRVLDVNLKGPFVCMREAVPAMVAAGGGSIVALGSVLGLMASPGYPAYVASKGALVNLCKQVAIEHAPDQVRVNVVAPSAVDAGLFRKMTERTDDPEGLKARIAATMPMRRLGTADEVGATVAFLLSDGAAYISGTVIPVDGAMAARRPV